MIHFIDVSSAQATGADWCAVKAAGIAGAWVKASEGNTGKDPAFRRHLEAGSLAGVWMGAYHFCRPSRAVPTRESIVADARVEADNFHAACGGWGSTSETLPPLIDLEASALTRTDDLLVWLGAHITRVEELFGVKPVLYTGLGFTSKFPGFERAEWLVEYLLMNANYPTPNGKALSPLAAETRKPPTVAPWERATVWQFSGGGMGVPGNTCPGFGKVPIDRSIAYVASLDDLRVVCG